MSDALRVGILFNAVTDFVQEGDVDYISYVDVLEQAQAVENALQKLGFHHQTFVLEDDIESIIHALKLYGPDVIINLCEAALGESHLEMNVPCLLELLRIPYTGSAPLTLGICQNKGLTKEILRTIGVPTPKYQLVGSFDEWKGHVPYPLIVKPLKEDASLGITRDSYVRNDEELNRQVRYVVGLYGQPALVEEYVDGRELNVSILGYENPQALPISEITFDFDDDEPRIVSYPAKWIKESEEYKKTRPICPAKLEPSTEEKVRTVALMAYKALYCRDYARVDIRLRDNVPYVLEINPNPDISPDAGFARSLKTAGIPYEEFVRKIITFALDRKQGQRFA